jgi:L,D-transpeptidase-like protein
MEMAPRFRCLNRKHALPRDRSQEVDLQDLSILKICCVSDTWVSWIDLQYLPHWKRLASYGAASATLLCLSGATAAAWEGAYYRPYRWSVPWTTQWQPRWHYSSREHHKSRHRPRSGPVLLDRKVTGPLLIVVSIAQQNATVFAADGEIASTPVSTGVPGHQTPLGVFSVIQKEVSHESNLYSAAPMPYMQRITWSGIALHAGVLPGHPASHGCIRMPRDFAVKVYSLTKIGARVVVTADDPAPVAIEHRTLFQPKPPEQAADSTKPAVVASADVAAPQATHPDITGSATSDAAISPAKEAQRAAKALRQNGAVSIFVSRKEGKLYARYKFASLFEMPVTINEPERPIGTHVFTAVKSVGEGRGLRWTVLTIPSRTSEKKRERHSRERQTDSAGRIENITLPSASDALDRVNIPDEARARVADMLAPGASLIISDNALSDETDSDTDFVVLTP